MKCHSDKLTKVIVLVLLAVQEGSFAIIADAGSGRRSELYSPI